MSSDPVNAWTDTELADGLRRGDGDCLGEVARRYGTTLKRFCAAYLADAARAEDVVQDTLGKLTQPEAAPNGELRPWLYRLARNRCLDILRRQERSPTHGRPLRTGFDAPTRTAGPGTRLAREERRELLRQIVAQMPEEYRSVLMLKFVEDLPRKEIATVLGLTEAAVKGRLVRASVYLEDELRKYTWTQP